MEISLALLPAFIHVYIFALESLMWEKKRTNKVFRMTEAEAQTTKLMAFNQGFYNLFLAIAIFFGLHLRTSAMTQSAGTVLVIYGLASIIAAGAVLILSSRQLWRAALIQIIPAAIAIVPYFK